MNNSINASTPVSIETVMTPAHLVGVRYRIQGADPIINSLGYLIRVTPDRKFEFEEGGNPVLYPITPEVAHTFSALTQTLRYEHCDNIWYTMPDGSELCGRSLSVIGDESAPKFIFVDRRDLPSSLYEVTVTPYWEGMIIPELNTYEGLGWESPLTYDVLIKPCQGTEEELTCLEHITDEIFGGDQGGSNIVVRTKDTGSMKLFVQAESALAISKIIAQTLHHLNDWGWQSDEIVAQGNEEDHKVYCREYLEQVLRGEIPQRDLQVTIYTK